jgi:threonine dehydrogenase-like Zn-dependent dehydrogenase
MAAAAKAETIDFMEGSVYDRLMAMTRGRGPDRCIDAVGCEAHGAGSFDAVVDKVKAGLMLATDRAHVLREAIMCCRKGGTLSIPGAYVGMVDKLPIGAAMNKGLTFKMGQTHVQRYLKPLLAKIEAGEIDPSFVITHRVPLADAPAAYKTFRDKQDAAASRSCCGREIRRDRLPDGSIDAPGCERGGGSEIDDEYEDLGPSVSSGVL